MLFIIHNKVHTYIILIRPLLEARAEIQKYFRSFFGSNENFEICFRDLLPFTVQVLQRSHSKMALFFVHKNLH